MMMMIQRRIKPHVATAKVAKKVDHWDFLQDEIEAPMWADLDLEVSSCYKDNDDDWFNISHPVHQCSSRKLKSALSRAGEAKPHVGLGLKGSSSPNLPPSVSRSRGKKNRIKDGTHGNGGTIASKQHHPIKNLNGKFSWVSSESSKKLKPKPSSGRSKATSDCDSSLTECTSHNSSNPTAIDAESKTTSSSTITYESGVRQLNYSEVSNQGLGQTSGLLLTLRKSCVRRQAMRVESVGSRQSRGRKSSSGKSSVGSSSHPGYDTGNAIGSLKLKTKEVTPDSRNVNRMPLTNLDKAIVSNASKKSNVDSSATKCGTKTIGTKFVTEETAKSKVAQVGSSKVPRLRRVNEPLAAVTNTNCKTEIRRYNRLGDGKENANIRTRTGIGGVFQVQKVKKPSAPLKIDKPGLIGTKVKVSSRDEKKCSTNTNRNIHFR